jgi:hypothetical protein
MGWQAVSTLLHDSPFASIEYSHAELALAAARLGLTDPLHRLFQPVNADAFSDQITFLYHLLLLVLDSKDHPDADFERKFVVEQTPRSEVARCPGATQFFRTPRAISADTRHLFVEGLSGHSFLLNAYASIPRSQVVTLPVNTWQACEHELAHFETQLTPNLESVTFVTLEPLVYSANGPYFIEMLRRISTRKYGILHRLPWTPEHGALLREAAREMSTIFVLAENMAPRLKSLYGVSNVSYLPLHPTYARYMRKARTTERSALGVLPHQVVISTLGEARHGKGIDLLLQSLSQLRDADREEFFFLFAGRAKDFSAADIRARLSAARCKGLVDLRESADPLNYSVLTDRELGGYINASDVGMLLYQDDQRNCMSGVLPNYVWGCRPVVATANSIVGEIVSRHALGGVVKNETPEGVVAAIRVAISQSAAPSMPPAYEAFRQSIAPEAVVRMLGSALAAQSAPDSLAAFLS